MTTIVEITILRRLEATQLYNDPEYVSFEQ